MLARPALREAGASGLWLCVLAAGALAFFSAIASPAHAQPTLDADLRTTWTSSDPPASNDTESPIGFFTPFNSNVSVGGAFWPCSTPPNNPTFTRGVATQNSTASPLFYMGTGTATAIGDGGSCGCAVNAFSSYQIRFTTTVSYDATVNGTFEDGALALGTQAGSTFVELGPFTGTHNETVTIPPGTYDLNVLAAVTPPVFTPGTVDSFYASFDFSVQLSPTGTVAVDEMPAAFPSFFLKAPQPNPSRSITVLELGMDKQAHVTLTVHDVSGRIIRSLMDGPLSAGGYRVSWDGRDQRGSRVASGMYFLRAFTEGRSATRRIIRVD